jgi:very-short-patch-repair endonuclease
LDQATVAGDPALERMVNEADVLDLINPDAPHEWLDVRPGEPGVRRLRTMLDRHTFRLSDSELERLFRPIALAANLPLPLTKVFVNGFEVDFYWPDLKLVVEADSLRYHRTASKQSRDLLRDQTHTAAGLTTLRFNHWQVKHEQARVTAVLADTGGLLGD